MGAYFLGKFQGILIDEEERLFTIIHFHTPFRPERKGNNVRASFDIVDVTGDLDVEKLRDTFVGHQSDIVTLPRGKRESWVREILGKPFGIWKGTKPICVRHSAE